MNNLAPVLCIGGMHFDNIAQCLSTFRTRASNPVRSHRVAGGVAHNIACDLVSLSTPSSLLSLVGGDADGDAILQDTKARGVDMALVSQMPGLTTANYTAVLDTTGELAVGLSDTETYNQISPDFLAAIGDQLQKYKILVVDANLPEQSLDWLAANKSQARLFAAPVSPSKALRWKRAIKHVDVFIGNEREADQLSGLTVATVSEALQAARALRALGPAIAVVTLGPRGAVLSAPELEAHFAIPDTNVEDVNGAGDAFFAGFTHALNADLSLEDAMVGGIASASIMAETLGPVWDDITPQRMNARLKAVPPGRILK
ncbi:MAG: hypothetical protein HQ514_19960 [Rhodospirillales bacterium]|nr:hypothetical protein [Rhodospirillales bacterium]